METEKRAGITNVRNAADNLGRGEHPRDWLPLSPHPSPIQSAGWRQDGRDTFFWDFAPFSSQIASSLSLVLKIHFLSLLIGICDSQ